MYAPKCRLKPQNRRFWTIGTSHWLNGSFPQSNVGAVHPSFSMFDPLGFHQLHQISSHIAAIQDSINTLGGVVSALALSFVLGLQYMVAPGTDEMQYADFRSLLCKSQEPPGLVEVEQKGG